MTADASHHAVVEAALVLLEPMGLTPADLTAAEYVPVVSAAVSAGTRRAYGSYWNRVVDQWGDRRLDEPTPSGIRQLMAYVKTRVAARCDLNDAFALSQPMISHHMRVLHDAGLLDREKRGVRVSYRAPQSTRRSAAWPPSTVPC